MNTNKHESRFSSATKAGDFAFWALWLATALMAYAAVIFRLDGRANEAAYRQLENTTRVLALNYLAARPDANPSAFDEAVARILVEGNAKKDGACICVPDAVVAFNRRYVFPSDGNQSHRLALAQGEPAKALTKVRVGTAPKAQADDFGDGGPEEHETGSKTDCSDVRVAEQRNQKTCKTGTDRGTEKPTDRDGLSRHDVGKKRKHEEKIRA